MRTVEVRRSTFEVRPISRIPRYTFDPERNVHCFSSAAPRGPLAFNQSDLCYRITVSE